MSLKKEIAKKSGLLGIFYVVSKFINFIYFFIITNLLGPAEYGILSLGMSIYETSAIPHNSINNALVKYIAEKKQGNYLKLVLKMEVFLGFIIAPALILFSDSIAALLNQPISLIIKLVGVLYLAFTIRETLSNALLGISKIRYYSINEIAYNIIKLILITLIVLKIGSAFGALVAILIATFISALLLFRTLRKIKLNNDPVKAVPVLNFGFKYFAQLMLLNLQPQIYIMLLAMFWPSAEIGYYKFLYSLIIIAMPSFIMLVSTVLQNYYSRFHFLKNKNDMENLFGLSLRIGAILICLASLVLMAVLGIFIRLMFNKYAAAIPLIPYFVVFGIVCSIYFLINSLIKATDNIQLQIKAQIPSLAVALVASVVLIPRFGALGAIISGVFAISVATVLCAYLIIKKLGIKPDLIPKKEDFILLRKAISPSRIKELLLK